MLTEATVSWLDVGFLYATHISESVPGSVLDVLSPSGRPFLATDAGACYFSAQQESQGRQQEEEHLLKAEMEEVGFNFKRWTEGG